jgi:DNA invertase Pin-like site-specific DNA recombinase
MATRTYMSYVIKKRPDGSVKRYPAIKKYTVKTELTPITPEQSATIMKDYFAGNPATKIAPKLNISVDRVRRHIKNNKTKLVIDGHLK